MALEIVGRGLLYARFYTVAAKRKGSASAAQNAGLAQSIHNRHIHFGGLAKPIVSARADRRTAALDRATGDTKDFKVRHVDHVRDSLEASLIEFRHKPGLWPNV
ncbi:hypothetical protein GGQ64_003392 [Rhizobium azooxidifex]|uniref:Uncharacterized protein n=1 Tax=Mycoplana azooxidifex TaxID=1636188 RepID=A0A7W6DE97_9HYPH|nr:hypothetical protein [Mycoplana azooxidifex]MBB3978178.1 hypothetical protein [Mycoplana azooxidifex]